MTVNYFDEDVAATYDDDFEIFDPLVVNPVVAFLVNLAGEGNALELGIGTGRIALPISARGVSVSGIELSQPMVARLAAKPGSDKVAVTIGDFSTTRIEESFSVVYLVFNTIMNLTTQAAQVACFQNAAAHLEPGGAFVIEVMVPGLQKLPHGETLVPFELSETHWGIDEYDIATQGLISHHLNVAGENMTKFAMPCRYVWPAELDLMAQLAGLTLSRRWGGWHGEPFVNSSQSHVSVWVTSSN